MLMRIWNIVRYGAYIPTEYMVSSEFGLIYVPIPKVACTAVKEALFYGGKLADDHEQYMEVHRKAKKLTTYSIKNDHRKWPVLAVVRNPFERLVSCYLDKVKKPVQHNGRYYFDSRYAQIFLQKKSGMRIHHEMSFEDFVTMVSRIPDWLADGHFRSQAHFLKDLGKGTDVAYLFRFETLETDWRVLQKNHQGLPDLRKRNSTPKKALHEWFDSEEILELAYERYRYDVDLWYSKEYQELRERVRGGG